MYWDINITMYVHLQLPVLSMKSLDGYLAAFENKLDHKAKHLSCLLCIRSASLLDSKHFVSAR